MNSNRRQIDWEDAQLVAYLDGELSEQESSQLDQQLSADVELQRRLSELQKAWDLLDVLPQPSTNVQLAQSTIELVTMELLEERNRRSWPSLLRRPWWWLVTVSLACFLLGGAAAGLFHQSSMRRMVQLLPVLTKFSDLSLIDSPEWLEKLAEIERLLEAGLPLYVQNGFPSEPSHQSEIEPWIENLDTNLRVQLSENFEAFQSLPQNRKESIVGLNRMIQSHSNPDYARILQAYSGLVRQIGSAELAQLEADEDLNSRSNKIQQVVYRELAIGYASQLSEQEREGIRQWANQLKESHFEYFFGIEDPDSEIILMLDPPMASSIIEPQEIVELIARISPTGRSLLDRLDEGQRSKALRLWVFTSLLGSRTRPSLTTSQLKEIFNSLPVERQNELIYMSGNEVIKQLKESVSAGSISAGSISAGSISAGSISAGNGGNRNPLGL
jgi:hypothetical protein